jgi:hypothetical protein
MNSISALNNETCPDGSNGNSGLPSCPNFEPKLFTESSSSSSSSRVVVAAAAAAVSVVVVMVILLR